MRSKDMLCNIFFDILSDKSSNMFSDTLSNISLWHSFQEHWAEGGIGRRGSIEVRQGTLGVAARCRGPAGNTARRGSQLRSGSAHWRREARG